MLPSERRLADLLLDPHETLEIELKGWLDISGNEHRAVLAKALIALANHGGGFVLIGFEDADAGAIPAANRPANMAGYTPDTVNAAVLAYAEPAFHCDVCIINGPDGLLYPIISVPGGHRVPIKARRDGPNGQGIKKNCYYIRRPGPQSEEPQNGHEWDALIRRCLTNARDELLDQMRGILEGGTPAPQIAPTYLNAVAEWHAASLARWQELFAGHPEKDPARLPQGYFALSYVIGGPPGPLGAAALLEALRKAQIRHTGWAEFWVPTREGIKPYMHEGNVECWIARDGQAHGAAHSDFWRASPDGKLFLIRGYQEDEVPDVIPAGTGFDLTIPTWRVGEALLHAANMAVEFGDPTATITALFEWTGLQGRAITHLARTRSVFDDHISQQGTFRTTISAQADQVATALPELVGKVVRPLYELFDFFRIPDALPAEELTKMRANRF